MAELTDEQKQERDVLDRILERGDLTVIGLPVADIGDIYKIVQEWRIMGGRQRWIDDLRRRESLKATLREIYKLADDAVRGEAIRFSVCSRIRVLAREALDAD